MFSSSPVFNQALSFDTSQVTNMQGMFSFCTNFNQPFTFITSAVTEMQIMFWGATNFNQPLVQGQNGWDTSSVNYMCGMFAGAYAFNQNIGSWDVTSIIGNFDCGGLNPKFMGGFGYTLSSTNLDLIYQGWASYNVPPGLVISFPYDVNYTILGGQAARDVLTNTYGWIITDGGGV
jgi:hypothetical protein